MVRQQKNHCRERGGPTHHLGSGRRTHISTPLALLDCGASALQRAYIARAALELLALSDRDDTSYLAGALYDSIGGGDDEEAERISDIIDGFVVTEVS